MAQKLMLQVRVFARAFRASQTQKIYEMWALCLSPFKRKMDLLEKKGEHACFILLEPIFLRGGQTKVTSLSQI